MPKPIEDDSNAAAFRQELGLPAAVPSAAGNALLTAANEAAQRTALGLGNVDNTSDANKPVSSAQAAALDTKMNNTLPALQSVFDGGTPAQKATFRASVSGYVATFQDLLNITLPSPGGRACVVSPVFSGGIPYTRWIYDGAAWRLDGPQDLLIDLSPSVGAASTAEQILKQTTAAPGLLLALRYFIIRTVVAKSGVTDVMSASRIRFGANGTISDSALFGDSGLTAANRQRAAEVPLFATSTTVLRHYTNGFGGGMAQAVVSQAYPTQVTVANMLSEAKFSFCAQMAGTTDTPTMVSVFISGG